MEYTKLAVRKAGQSYPKGKVCAPSWNFWKEKIKENRKAGQCRKAASADALPPSQSELCSALSTKQVSKWLWNDLEEKYRNLLF